jgi:hypothetical protein
MSTSDGGGIGQISLSSRSRWGRVVCHLRIQSEQTSRPIQPQFFRANGTGVNNEFWATRTRAGCKPKGRSPVRFAGPLREWIESNRYKRQPCLGSGSSPCLLKGLFACQLADRTLSAALAHHEENNSARARCCSQQSCWRCPDCTRYLRYHLEEADMVRLRWYTRTKRAGFIGANLKRLDAGMT